MRKSVIDSVTIHPEQRSEPEWLELEQMAFFCAGDKTVVGLLARLCEGDVASRSSSAIFSREKTRCPRVRKMIMKDVLRSCALFSSAKPVLGLAQLLKSKAAQIDVYCLLRAGRCG
jgi:hypothetical protein